MATDNRLSRSDLQAIARRLEILQAECKHGHMIVAPGCEPMCERCGMGKHKIDRLELIRRVKQGGRDGT